MNPDTIARVITRHQNRTDAEVPAALCALRDLACGVLEQIDKQRRFMAAMGLAGGWDKPTPDELALRKATGAGEPEPLKIAPRRRPGLPRHDRERFEAASTIIHRGQLAMMGRQPPDPVLHQVSPPNLHDIVRAALVIESQINALKGRAADANQDERTELDYWMSVAFECMEHLANAQPDANSIIPPEAPPPRYIHTDAENAVRVRISNMPGGGAYTSLNTAGRRVGFNGTTPCPITMDSVAAYLGELSSIRHYELEEHGRVKTKLDSLQTTIGGARKLFAILAGGES